MRERVVRWVGGGLVLGLLPFVCAYAFSLYRTARAPALHDLLGDGRSLLVTVAWCAAALREAFAATLARKSQREVIQILATLALFGSAAFYGFVAAGTTGGQVQTPFQKRFVTRVSLGLLVMAGATSTFATAINEPGKEQP